MPAHPGCERGRGEGGGGHGLCDLGDEGLAVTSRTSLGGINIELAVQQELVNNRFHILADVPRLLRAPGTMSKRPMLLYMYMYVCARVCM